MTCLFKDNRLWGAEISCVITFEETFLCRLQSFRGYKQHKASASVFILKAAEILAFFSLRCASRQSDSSDTFSSKNFSSVWLAQRSGESQACEQASTNESTKPWKKKKILLCSCTVFLVTCSFKCLTKFRRRRKIQDILWLSQWRIIC